ncbi:alpha/beta hydrolase [Planotetraspora mira]|uniref:Hydrolase n=1 Tax=Planotetraspora mira TaxID=58121 RepID=A0A8J3X8T1_9ACTN|nr:alpha/beta hydrolase [Planotetraspora mira]GII27858.1 hydrolase [Planotetraspora mira]
MSDEIDADIHPEYPVSWQAAALNGVLRGTMKPISTILLRNTTGMAVASRLICLGERVPGMLPKHVTVRRERFESCAGEWVRGGDDIDESKALLYFHGGAYFICSAATHRPITWRLSAVAKRPVLAIDYRQGPIHTLAHSLTDALEAYQSLLDRGHRPKDILLAGDSAGGHLALATLLSLRDQGRPLPAAAICMSPWTDLSDVRRRVNCWSDPLLPAGRVDWLARRWTDGLDCRDPLVSPVFGDYTGIPPLMIVTGSTEILRDDGRRVAASARENGVPVTYEEWNRMPHVFAILADVVPEARLVFQHISRFIGAVEARSERSGQEAA